MKTLVLHHDDCLRHENAQRHPERPERVLAVLDSVRELSGVECLPAPRATAEQLLRVHDNEHWNTILELNPGDEPIAVDPDTWVSRGSVDATLRGSGAACFAIDQVAERKVTNAFCAVRPPGHHAEPARAMGFCLLNHVAVAARHARSVHGLERIAILDFDVHHGNGTQAIFNQDPDTLFISSHQYPHYPGTGEASETGCGNIINLPLSAGDGSVEFRAAWTEAAFPALGKFRPDLVLVSAGFDAHASDPLGDLLLEDDDFDWITACITDLSASLCDHRVVSLLEGGYDLPSLASAATRHVNRLTR
jgi:acetoin utilization deacetylase AcuC-like enzyme